MTPQQKILKVIVLHNRLLTEPEIDSLIALGGDPEDVIDRMAIGELVNETVAEKLRSLYEHNLRKQGLPVPVRNSVVDEDAASPSPFVERSEAAREEHAGPSEDQHAQAHGEYAPARAGVSTTAQDQTSAATQGGRATIQHQPPVHSNHEHSRDLPYMEAAGGEGQDRKWDADAEPVIKLLKIAREMRASDLHVMAGSAPAVRVASTLRDLDSPPPSQELVEKSLLALLSPAQRAEFTRTNDLDCSFDAGPKLGRFRLNMLRQHRGVGGVFRLIPERVPTFEELKLPEQIRKFTQYRQGIVLVTGPKGSGKTTTLAAIIDLINAHRAEHIITIEDPIEFVQPSKMGHVNQREVGVHTKSFAAALRASLREAPDVIMVGEMRDLETVALAITAAETGHLVFGTLHTPDSQRTINRVIDVFPPKEQGQIRAMFSESLRGVLSQHLLPGVDGKSMHLATEILFNTSAIANLIRDNRTFQIHGIMQTHRKMGMHLMDDSLIHLVKEGKVSKEEAMSRADNAPFMEKELAAMH